MWLINVVIIITFVYFIVQIVSKAVRKKEPALFVIIALAIFFESLFIFYLLSDEKLNNILQALVLIFAYLIPMALVTVKGLAKNAKITLVYYVAKFMYLIGNYEFAEGLLARIMTKARKNAEFYYLRSKALEKMGKLAEARDVLISSLTVDNNNEEIYYKIAVLLDKLGNKEAAIAMLNQAVTIDNTYIEAKEMLGILFSDLGHLNEAKTIYEDIAMNNIATADTFFNLAVIYSALGEIKNAIPAYEKALELDDEMYEAYYSVGRLYYAKEEYDLAKENLEKASKDKELKAKSEYSIALISMKTGDINDAIYHVTNATNEDEAFILMAKKERLFKPIMSEIYGIEESVYGKADEPGIDEEQEENIEE
ncbi:MAG: tetratricopeptide repeat protein [Clostridia bacterium]|nr:tetratricopeptide repeat protein [Clostridia bacterium]